MDSATDCNGLQRITTDYNGLQRTFLKKTVFHSFQKESEHLFLANASLKTEMRFPRRRHGFRMLPNCYGGVRLNYDLSR
jgi:hypothetical protein